MTTNSPRIYVYKITFDEVGHYYYGSHKEEYFDEYYMGSPVTHKVFWELYTPKKEYIEFFEFSDDGYEKALEFENSLIKPVYNIDPLCLNENCGGVRSLNSCRIGGKKAYEFKLGAHNRSKEKMSEDAKKAGKITYERGVGVHALTKQELSEAGKKVYNMKLGIHGLSEEERRENSSKAGKSSYERGVGIHGLSEEERRENSSKAGKRAYELRVGIHGRSKEKMIEDGRRTGIRFRELGIGVCGRSKEKMSEDGKKAGKVGGKRAHELGVGVHGLTKEERIQLGKKTNSQRWQCTITGHVSTPGGLSSYQKARGIDLSNRIRIQ